MVQRDIKTHLRKCINTARHRYRRYNRRQVSSPGFKWVPSCSLTFLFPFCQTCEEGGVGGALFAPSLACGPPAFLLHDCIPPPWVRQVWDRPAVAQWTLLSLVFMKLLCKKKDEWDHHSARQLIFHHTPLRPFWPPPGFHWFRTPTAACDKKEFALSWDLQSLELEHFEKKSKQTNSSSDWKSHYRYKFEQTTMESFSLNLLLF